MKDERYYTVEFRGKNYSSFVKLKEEHPDILENAAKDIVYSFDQSLFARKSGALLKTKRMFTTTYTQETFAAKVGSSRAKIGNQEQGASFIAFSELAYYASILNTSVYELLPLEICQPVFDYDKNKYGLAFFKDIKKDEYKEIAIEAIRGIAGMTNPEIASKLKNNINEYLQRINVLDDIKLVDKDRYTAKYLGVLGARLQLLREINELTSSQIADLCHVHPSTIRSIEIGRRAPSYDLLYRLMFIYGIDASVVIPTNATIEDIYAFSLEMSAIYILSNVKDETLIECCNECIRTIYNVERTAELKSEFNAQI